MPQILRAFDFTGEVTIKMAEQTHGQAHKDLRTVIGLAATWAFMQIPRTPEGATKRGHVNAALVTALRSFGSLITAALSMNPDTRALAAEGGDAAWAGPQRPELPQSRGQWTRRSAKSKPKDVKIKDETTLRKTTHGPNPPRVRSRQSPAKVPHERPDGRGLNLPERLTAIDVRQICAEPVDKKRLGSFDFGDILLWVQSHDHSNESPIKYNALRRIFTELGFGASTLNNPKSVAKKFPPNERNHNVEWDHYDEVRRKDSTRTTPCPVSTEPIEKNGRGRN